MQLKYFQNTDKILTIRVLHLSMNVLIVLGMTRFHNDILLFLWLITSRLRCKYHDIIQVQAYLHDRYQNNI